MVRVSHSPGCHPTWYAGHLVVPSGRLDSIVPLPTYRWARPSTARRGHQSHSTTRLPMRTIPGRGEPRSSLGHTHPVDSTHRPTVTG